MLLSLFVQRVGREVRRLQNKRRRVARKARWNDDQYWSLQQKKCDEDNAKLLFRSQNTGRGDSS